jgi:hypothetical protein
MKKLLLLFYILIFIKTTVAQLGSPVLIEPPTKDAAVSQTATLDWADVPGAEYYEVQISVLDNFSDITGATYTPDNTSIYSVPVGTLAPFTKYYWRIRAINSTETGPWSEVWEFTTIGTSAEEIVSLQGEVTQLANDNKLPQNQAIILNNKLDAALNRINNNQEAIAIINILVFDVRVAALVISNHLPASDGQDLIRHANRIITLIEGDNIKGLTEEELNTANKFSLTQNYPNPFNPVTTIEFTIPVKSYVTLKIYDIQGREVATLIDQERNAGLHIVNWNAGGFSSGVYFYRLTAGTYTDTKRMMLTK